MKQKEITKYIKREYPKLYEKRKMNNRMTLDGESAINLLALTESEISSLGDKRIGEYITGIKEVFKLIFYSTLLLIIIAICRYIFFQKF